MIFDENNFPSLPSSWSSLVVDASCAQVTIKKKIATKEYLEKGNLAIIDQGAKLIGGYWNDLLSAVDTELPVIIFGDHTRILKYIDFPFAAGADGIKVLRPHAFFHPKLFFRFLQIIKLPDRGYSRHFQFLRSSVIAIPPENEQKRITDKLDTVLAKVDACRDRLDRIPVILKRFRQSVLAAATSGALTEDWRFEDKAKLQIGNESWVEHSFGDLYQLIDGDRGPNYPKQGDYFEDGYCLFLSTKNVRPFGFLFEQQVYISGQKHEQLRNGTLQINDVVITTRGTLGNVAVYDDTTARLHPVVRINSGMLIIREMNPGMILQEYLKLFIASPNFTAQLTAKQTGSAQPQIPAGILKTFSIQVPSLEEQTEIVRRVESLFAFADRLEARYTTASAQVEQLTPALLAKAFRGELVPQDPNDEPASELLARIEALRATDKPNKTRKPTSRKTLSAPKENVTMTKSRQDDDVKNHAYLAGHLKLLGGSAVVESLFKVSELPVADFYKQLAWEVEQGFVIDKQTVLEAVDAS